MITSDFDLELGRKIFAKIAGSDFYPLIKIFPKVYISLFG